MASVATMIGQSPPASSAGALPSRDGEPSPDGGPVSPGALTSPGASGAPGLPEVVRQAGLFPRLRYMGSKYRLIPHLARAFTELGGTTALDAFSGSGVVSYLLKACGYQVTANDFLAFPAR